MRNDKTLTLKKLSEASAIVDDARFDENNSENERNELEKISTFLRNLERLLIRDITNEVLDKLTNDTKDLKELSKQIESMSAKLKKVSKILEKTVSMLESFINGISGI